MVLNSQMRSGPSGKQEAPLSSHSQERIPRIQSLVWHSGLPCSSSLLQKIASNLVLKTGCVLYTVFTHKNPPGHCSITIKKYAYLFCCCHNSHMFSVLSVFCCQTASRRDCLVMLCWWPWRGLELCVYGLCLLRLLSLCVRQRVIDIFLRYLFIYLSLIRWKERSSKVGGHLIYPQRIYHFRLCCTLLGDCVLRHLQWTRFVLGKIYATRFVLNVECKCCQIPILFQCRKSKQIFRIYC